MLYESVKVSCCLHFVQLADKPRDASTRTLRFLYDNASTVSMELKVMGRDLCTDDVRITKATRGRRRFQLITINSPSISLDEVTLSLSTQSYTDTHRVRHLAVT